MTLKSGTQLGTYEVLSPLGAGGMGEVYRARDTKLGRDVAIKVLPDTFAQNPERLARFKREAKLLASLNHPNIATIHGLEESGGTHYLVMEMVPGDTLAVRIQHDGAVPIEETLSICTQIAEALEHAHEKGVIHRDLKPANVKVTPEGKVKVLDFGLAKAFAEPSATDAVDSQSPTLMTASPTMPGVILGTAAYMSPEQAKGKPIDKRTDIWAFGCVLYKLLTGKQVFEGESSSEILGAIHHKEPDWDVLPETTPPGIRALLRRCLKKVVNHRLRDAGDLRIQIEDSLNAPSTASAGLLSTKPLWRRAMPWTVAVVLSVVVGIAVWNLRPAPSLPVTRMVVALQADEAILHTTIVPLALSPDGSNMVYSAQQGTDPVRLYLRPMNSLEEQLLSGTDGASNPFFSPDGQWVGFFTGAELKKVRITGGAVLTIASTGTVGLGANWGADDRIIYTTRNFQGLMQVSADGGTPESLTMPDTSSSEYFHLWPEILPGGQAVLFGTFEEGTNDPSIVAQRLDTGERKVLLQGCTFPHYVSTGHLVYNREGTLMAVPFNLDRLEISGSPVPVLEGIRSPGSALGGAQFAISRTGTLAYMAGSAEDSASTLVWVDRQGVSEPLSAPPREYEFPRVSPDGQRVAAGIRENETHVWAYDISRDTLTRQTFEGRVNSVPIWSPDGKRLAFISTRDGSPNMFWQMADGSGGVEQLSTNDYQTVPASFSPDGQRIAFIEDKPETGRAIRVLNLADREAETFLQTPNEETAPKFSPDGKWMAYVSNESGRREVYVQPYPGPGGKWQISNDGGQEPVWNPQGGELFYRSGNRMIAVALDTESGFSAATPQMLFEGSYLPTTVTFPYYDVSPDGQRFLMLEPVESQTGGTTQINVVLNWFEELKQRVPVQ